MIANFSASARLGSITPGLYNFFVQLPVVKKLVGFAPKRSMPLLHKTTLRRWWNKQEKKQATRKVYLFCDEFTNYNDVEIGIKAVHLLERLGYEVMIPEHLESGRTWLSKGLVREAKKIVNKNIALLSSI